MDIEKLIERLRTESLFADKASLEIMDLCMEAATALSTLRAENEKLRAEVESLKKGHCAGCSIPAVKAEQIRDLTDAPKLRAELEQVKAERDAAIKDLKMVAVCDTCANEHNPSCPGCNDAENWDWRGGQKERRYENI